MAPFVDSASSEDFAGFEAFEEFDGVGVAVVRRDGGVVAVDDTFCLDPSGFAVDFDDGDHAAADRCAVRTTDSCNLPLSAWLAVSDDYLLFINGAIYQEKNRYCKYLLIDFEGR